MVIFYKVLRSFVAIMQCAEKIYGKLHIWFGLVWLAHIGWQPNFTRTNNLISIYNRNNNEIGNKNGCKEVNIYHKF